jgi:hypothetical protein
MIKILLFILCLNGTFVFAQDINAIINAKEVERIEKTLSADDMQGRRVNTPGIEKAAIFIADEFNQAGLSKAEGKDTYLQEFSMVKAKFKGLSCLFDNAEINSRNVIVVTTQPDLVITEKSGYEIVTISAGSSFFTEARKYINAPKNYIVLVDTSYSKNFSRLIQIKNNLFKSNKSSVFVLGTQTPTTYTISATHEITEQKLANVVAVVPGKTKPNEYVIFSGHYDHLGINSKRSSEVADSIFNGANDDAAGTTAVIMLAKYFKQKNDNARTLVFAAFTAEEVGGFGSQYFSKQFNAEQVIAMFNIEMIGTESKWGKGSAYITGYDKTDMGKILQSDLEGSAFNFYPDPYTTENLFYRSDNATLARLGVPAHTISTSKMDNEPNYHKVSDEFGTLDMNNMAEIIKAIALSSKGIIKGTQTPSRVDIKGLN